VFIAHDSSDAPHAKAKVPINGRQIQECSKRVDSARRTRFRGARVTSGQSRRRSCERITYGAWDEADSDGLKSTPVPPRPAVFQPLMMPTTESKTRASWRRRVLPAQSARGPPT
jgi:hypothetical protein